jgi:cob(I)alamin adenosyltransferase
MRLYTRTGDDGTTGLVGGGRTRKDAMRIAAIGEVDEINSALGLAACACSDPALRQIIAQLQNRLFSLGADLATVGGPDALTQPRIIDEDVVWAEQAIDALCAQLPPLTQFIMPGGTELAARLHLARAICRRAERTCNALAKAEAVDAAVLVYLNRLSDLLFAMARRANQLAGVADVTWDA